MRSGDRIVFIAECKIWNRPAKSGGAVDQLLDCLVWRDSGSHMLVLNEQSTLSVASQSS